VFYTFSYVHSWQPDDSSSFTFIKEVLEPVVAHFKQRGYRLALGDFALSQHYQIGLVVYVHLADTTPSKAL
jgi:hypothetical protein